MIDIYNRKNYNANIVPHLDKLIPSENNRSRFEIRQVVG